jgi:hypothetical protein
MMTVPWSAATLPSPSPVTCLPNEPPSIPRKVGNADSTPPSTVRAVMEILEYLLLKLLGMKVRRVKVVREKVYLVSWVRIEFWKLLFLVYERRALIAVEERSFVWWALVGRIIRRFCNGGGAIFVNLMETWSLKRWKYFHCFITSCNSGPYEDMTLGSRVTKMMAEDIFVRKKITQPR